MAYAVLTTGRKAVYADSEDAAVELAVLLEEEERDYLENVKFTFSNLYLHWFQLKLKEVRPQTADRIEYTYKKYFLSDSISSLDFRALDNLFLLEWILNILNSQQVTYKEYQRILQLLKGVYDYAVDFFFMPDTVSFDRIKKNIPKNKFYVSKKKEYAVSSDTISSFSDAVKGDLFAFGRPSATALLYCNFFLGLRIGELASLRWSDVDFDSECIHISHIETRHYERDVNGSRTGTVVYSHDSLPKTVSGIRVIPLIPEAKDVLMLIRRYHYFMGYESDFVAYDGSNAKAMASSLSKTLRRVCKQLGIPRFNPHLIRKTVATMLHNSGVPTRQVSDLLGHSDIATTERNYIISLEQNLDRMRKILSDALMR